MLKVRTYLPAMENYNTITDTAATDVTDLGEQANVQGIPEELIVPLGQSEQSNEDDKVIQDIFSRQDDEEEKEKEIIEKDDTADSTELEGNDFSGDASDEEEEPTAGEDNSDTFTTGDSTDGTQVEEKPTDEEEPEEESVSKIQAAVESYSSLLTTASDKLTHESASFLSIGLSHMQTKLNLQNISNEEYETGSFARSQFVSNVDALEKIKAITDAISK